MTEDKKFSFKSFVTFGQLVGMGAAIVLAFSGFGAWQGAVNTKVETLKFEQDQIKSIMLKQVEILSKQQAQIDLMYEDSKDFKKRLNAYEQNINDFYQKYELKLKK